MGFFSWNCIGCGNEVLNPYAGLPGEEGNFEWLNEVTVLLEEYNEPGSDEYCDNAVDLGNGIYRLNGVYDGYGNVGGTPLMDIPSTYWRMWHSHCWEVAGYPVDIGKMPCNSNAPNQGHFLDEEELRKIVIKPDLLLHCYDC